MRLSRQFVLAACLLGSLCAGTAFAQTADEKPALQQAGAEKGQSPGQNPLIRHVGTAAEAVVHLRVSLRDPKSGRTERREGSGVLIRCDGYVLVPTTLFAEGKDWDVPGKKRNNLVYFPKGEDQQAPPPPQEIPVLRFFNEGRGYVAAKLREVHAPGLPLLHPSNIRPGMRVQVVYARRNYDKPNEAAVETVEAVVGPHSGVRRWSFDEKAAALPKVLPGAVVVDKASGLAVGIVPGTLREGESPASATGFLDFSALYQMTNAVGLVPRAGNYTREEAQPEAAAERDGMIWVPAGEAMVPDETSRSVRACTPGFWIDKQPVTNEAYEKFLEATKSKKRPRPWYEQDRKGYKRGGDMPVQGVTNEEAAAYAEWAGKRLVTPTEWARASQGRLTTTWGAAYNNAQLLAIFRLRYAFWKQYGDQQGEPVSRREILRQKIAQLERSLELPPPAKMKPGFPDFAATSAGFSSFVAPVEKHFGYPNVLLRAGVREFDRSDFGVLDVALNPTEHLLTHQSLGRANAAVALKGVGSHLLGTPAGSTGPLREDVLPQWQSILVLMYVRNAIGTGELIGGDGLRVAVAQPLGPQEPGRRRIQGWILGTDSPPHSWNVVYETDTYFRGNPLWPPQSHSFHEGLGFRCAR